MSSYLRQFETFGVSLLKGGGEKRGYAAYPA